MRIAFIKISDELHRVEVTRADRSCERVDLKSREFLNHDLAHFVIEFELPIRKGYWGCVAAGASLTGNGVGGSDARFAEILAGPMQTLIRKQADLDEYSALFRDVAAGSDLAARVHERVRQLRGHWRATPSGHTMELNWPDVERAD